MLPHLLDKAPAEERLVEHMGDVGRDREPKGEDKRYRRWRLRI